MRRWAWTTILTTTLLLVGCAPPHPTHPVRVDCPMVVETAYMGNFDTSSLGPGTDPGNPAGPDPCSPGIATLRQWTQTGIATEPICMAAGSTTAQAISVCSQRFTALGRRVGDPAAPLLEQPPFGERLCPGSTIFLSSQIVSLGGTPGLDPEGCRADTRLPLLP